MMKKIKQAPLVIAVIIILITSISLIDILSAAESGSKRVLEFGLPLSEAAPVYSYIIIGIYPHDTSAFTEGLVINQGYLYESTGLYGNSSLRKVDLRTGRVLEKKSLPDWDFAEGLTLWNNSLIQLTWKSRVGFVYDENSFNQTDEFSYPDEGWGLTNDGEHLIMSDGTDTLRILNPNNFSQIGTIKVTDNETPVYNLNELEYIKGYIYANIYTTNLIAIIAPDTGIVKGWIDLSGLLGGRNATKVDVLNGIAYDANGDRIYVTGKFWPWLFEIEPI